MNNNDNDMVTTITSSFPTIINGEFSAFRSTSQADDSNSVLNNSDNGGYDVNNNHGGTDHKDNIKSPLESKDHSKLDISKSLDEAGIEKYQTLIKVMQWAVSIGRYDIHNDITTMSGCGVQPKDTNLPTHMTIGKCLNDFDTQLENNNEIVGFMTRETNEEDGEHWEFPKIIDHEKVRQNRKNYNGSFYNLRINWENGEVSDVPLQLFAHNAPLEYAQYATENDLLDEPS